MELERLCKPRGRMDIIEGVKSLRIIACIALFTALVFAEKHFSPPPAAHAGTYTLHETHSDEKVTIAADPCDTQEKAAVFKTNYRGYALYPVRLMISNDSDQTLMLQNVKIEYITARREKFPPMTDDDIYRRLVNPSRANKSKPGPHLPFPVGKKKDPLNKDVVEEYHSAQFLTVPVTPHSTHSGYLFFDMIDEQPEPGAHLYISGIKAGSKELFYFDIPMDASGTSPPPPK
jgi:hypothetical protein